MMNLRKKADGTYARHYADNNVNHTLCGLSLRQGHGWAKSIIQIVTCQQCKKIAWRRKSK